MFLQCCVQAEENSEDKDSGGSNSSSKASENDENASDNSEAAGDTSDFQSRACDVFPSMTSRSIFDIECDWKYHVF